MVTIIYEDDVLLVCNKPAGLMVEPDRNNHPNLLTEVKNYLKLKTGEKNPYVQHLHRLDRVTSGIVLFTKNKDYLRHLSDQFAQRQVKKQYVAITHSAPKKLEDSLEHWHRKEQKKATIYLSEIEYAEKAQLDYKIEPYKELYKWHINLHTGKYHQIRAQLAWLQCPIIGDEMYGSAVAYQANCIALHAESLTITHPVTLEQLKFTCEAKFHV